MPNLDSEYEEDCSTEEKSYEEEPPDTTDINLLTKEFKHKTELCTDL